MKLMRGKKTAELTVDGVNIEYDGDIIAQLKWDETAGGATDVQARTLAKQAKDTAETALEASSQADRKAEDALATASNAENKAHEDPLMRVNGITSLEGIAATQWTQEQALNRLKKRGGYCLGQTQEGTGSARPLISFGETNERESAVVAKVFTYITAATSSIYGMFTGVKLGRQTWNSEGEQNGDSFIYFDIDTYEIVMQRGKVIKKIDLWAIASQ